MTTGFLTTDLAIQSFADKLGDYGAGTMMWPDEFADYIEEIPIGEDPFGDTNNFNQLLAGTCTNLSDTFIFRIGGDSTSSFKFNRNIGSSIKSVNLRYCGKVGYGAFRSMSTLSIVNLSRVRTIGSEAFYNCSNITTMNIGNVKTMSNLALYGNSSKSVGFLELDLPELTYLDGSGQFAYNSQLTSISCPKMQAVTSQCFLGDTGLTSLDFPGALTVSEQAFQDCINLLQVNLPMTSNIASDAFSGCSNLKWVSAPKLVSVEASTFWSKTLLTSFYYGSALTEIGSQAFCGCFSLTTFENIEGEDNVSIVRTEGLRACRGITSISFPNCHTLYASCFTNCSNLSSVYLPKLKVVDGEDAFLSAPVKTALLGLSSFLSTTISHLDLTVVETLSLPECISLQSCAFQSNSTIKNLSVPLPSIIPASCFKDTKITNLNINSELSEVHKYAFYNCPAPLAISCSTLDYLDSSAFYMASLSYFSCSSEFSNRTGSFGQFVFARAPLRSIAIPSAITILGTACFSNCSYLSDITCDGVSTIYGYCFQGCGSSATTMSIFEHSSITQIIGNCAFADFNAKKISLPNLAYISGDSTFKICQSTTELYLRSLTSISGSYQFTTMSQLQSITLGLSYIPSLPNTVKYCSMSSVATILSTQFMGNTNLTSFYFGDDLAQIASCAFWNCTGLKTFSHHTGKTTKVRPMLLGSSHFAGCTNLQAFQFKARTTLQLFANVPDFCFQNCYNLSIVTGFESATKVGVNAFSCCSKLASISLPKVTSIATGAFFCAGLSGTLELPNISYIGDLAFCSCSKLVAIRLGSTQFCSNAGGSWTFSKCTALKSIYIPKAYWSSYRLDDDWRYYNAKFVSY